MIKIREISIKKVRGPKAASSCTIIDKKKYLGYCLCFDGDERFVRYCDVHAVDILWFLGNSIFLFWFLQEKFHWNRHLTVEGTAVSTNQKRKNETWFVG